MSQSVDTGASDAAGVGTVPRTGSQTSPSSVALVGLGHSDDARASRPGSMSFFEYPLASDPLDLGCVDAAVRPVLRSD